MAIAQEKALQSYLWDHIPISKAIGVTVECANLEQVILCAPFSNNINHKQTVFGGSLHAVATLACWSLLFLRLKQLNEHYQIVITKSEISYSKPVAQDFKICSRSSSINEWQAFLRLLEKKGKARIQLTSSLEIDGKTCVQYQGTFAAIKA
ncbi:MAG: YiiD C-terminal domain-containing protein [Parachlamydiaceae bacterium]